MVINTIMLIHEVTGKPGKLPKGETIYAYLPDMGVDGVMVMKWAKDQKWVEVRGENVWGEYNLEDPLQHVLDRLLGAHVSNLMAGMVINIHPGHPDYEFAKSLLAG